MLGFQWFWAVRGTIAGMEIMPALRTGHLRIPGNARQRPAEQFDALAA